MALTGADSKLPEPRSFAASAWKKQHGGLSQWLPQALRTEWQRKHIVLKAGCLHWSTHPISGADPTSISSSTAFRSVIDFSLTPCEAVTAEDSLGKRQILVRPLPGHRWGTDEAHHGAGADRSFVFDFSGSCSPTSVWLERFAEHIAFGRARVGDTNGVLNALRCTSVANLEKVDDVCPICLDDLQADAESVVATRCGHHFHAKCCCDWLATARSCPVCRASIVPHASLESAKILGLPQNVVADRLPHQPRAHAELEI
mmetsp:Transcript_138174/g.358969  ORF Transcript_138174/g.358969 Transcript_138174/m.358969 type:complete len:258 (-) Transcript_138174:442-1215(-)